MWIRLHEDFFVDDKIAALKTARRKMLFLHLCTLAREGKGIWTASAESACARLRTGEKSLRNDLGLMQFLGLIEFRFAETPVPDTDLTLSTLTIRITNWSKRQYEFHEKHPDLATKSRRNGRKYEEKTDDLAPILAEFEPQNEDDSAHTESAESESAENRDSESAESAEPQPATTPAPPGPTSAAAAALIASLSAAGLNRSDAKTLARTHSEEAKRQLEYLPYHQNLKNRGAYLRTAILNGYAAPPAYEEAQRAQKRRAAAQIAAAPPPKTSGPEARAALRQGFGAAQKEAVEHG